MSFIGQMNPVYHMQSTASIPENFELANIFAETPVDEVRKEM